MGCSNSRGDRLTRYDSGLNPLFWNTLFECIRRADELSPLDKRILIASPWLSDVELKGCRWHPSQISAMVDTTKFSNLVDVLGKLVDLGYRVDLVVAARKGKFLPPKNNSQVMREKKLIENATSKGIRCSFKSDFHSKELATPFALLSGSANWTNNGLWNLIEHLEFKHKDRSVDAPSFNQNLTTVFDTYQPLKGLTLNQIQVEQGKSTNLHPIHETEIVKPKPTGGQAFVAYVEEDSVLGTSEIKEKSKDDNAAQTLLDIIQAMQDGNSGEEILEKASMLLQMIG